MRLVFCGTPRFAVPTLEALLAAGHDVPLVISQPDKPVGRAGEVLPTPVKAAALAHGIAVVQPDKLKINPTLENTLRGVAPDAIIVVAYGRILPQWVLDLPRLGCINGHASLLPRWRGAAPIQWAIAAGDRETGVTTMRLNAGLDTGPMLLKRAMPITAATTSPEMFEALAILGADLMVETLAGLAEGSVVPQEQDDAAATLAPLLTREDARINFSRPAREVDQRFRAFQPWPGTYTYLRGRKLIVHAMHVAPDAPCTPPGVLIVHDGTLMATCLPHTAVILDEVQFEGRKRMAASEFLRGFSVLRGERLGEDSL